MNGPARPEVVVGVSGSRASVGALRWAAAESCRRGGLLVAVLAWEPTRPAYYAVQAVRHGRDQQHDAASNLLAIAVRAAFGVPVPGNLMTEVVEGLAERALIDRSAQADLLVLGSTSATALGGRSIGPVIRSCLSRARCPLVIVGPDLAIGAAADHDRDRPAPGTELAATAPRSAD